MQCKCSFLSLLTSSANLSGNHIEEDLNFHETWDADHSQKVKKHPVVASAREATNGSYLEVQAYLGTQKPYTTFSIKKFNP